MLKKSCAYVFLIILNTYVLCIIKNDENPVYIFLNVFMTIYRSKLVKVFWKMYSTYIENPNVNI